MADSRALYVVPWVLSLLAFFLRQSIFAVGELIVQVVFVEWVLVLYPLLRPVNKTHASLMMIL